MDLVEGPAENLSMAMIPAGLPIFFAPFAELDSGADFAAGNETNTHLTRIRIAEPGTVAKLRQFRKDKRDVSAGELPAVGTAADTDGQQIFSLSDRQEKWIVCRCEMIGFISRFHRGRAGNAVGIRFEPPVAADAELGNSVTIRLKAVVEHSLGSCRRFFPDQGVKINEIFLQRKWNAVSKCVHPACS